ncbi:MAG: SAF domain-containing protein [Pseudonocardiaceae bacterium]
MVTSTADRLADRDTGSAVPVGRGSWRAARPARRVPYLAVGGLLVVVCILAFAYTAATLGGRTPVLAVARPVAAGQVFTAADVRQVPAVDDAGLGLIPASQATVVVGRTAVVPLLPGTLLTRAVVGQAQFPPVGTVVASVALKPGTYPQGLAAGANVAVFLTSSVPAGGQQAPLTLQAEAVSPVRLSASVLGVDPGGDGQGATVVTLLTDAADADRLAGAAGVVLMQTPPGSG